MLAALSFILIVLDDARPDQLAYLNSIASRGIVFEHAYATTPICAPSRASILTGLRPLRHGVLTNVVTNQSEWQAAELDTLATRLQAAGWQTGFFGKYVESGGRIPPGWDRWWGFGSRASYAGRNGNPATIQTETGTLELTGPGSYTTDRSVDALLAWIDGLPRDADFFAVWAPFAPHVEIGRLAATPAGRHDGVLAGERAPRAPSFDEEDVSDKPLYVRGNGRVNAAILDRSWQRAAESLLAVDEGIGAIERALRRERRGRRTWVILTSDNGLAYGEHRLAGLKGIPYDESTRVPLVAIPPDGRFREEGRTASCPAPAAVSLLDLYPTLLDLAGIRAPHRDGTSFAPSLRNSRRCPRRHEVSLEFYGTGLGTGLPPRWFGWRNVADLTLTVTYGTGERERYDLHADPYALENLNEN